MVVEVLTTTATKGTTICTTTTSTGGCCGATTTTTISTADQSSSSSSSFSSSNCAVVARGTIRFRGWWRNSRSPACDAAAVAVAPAAASQPETVTIPFHKKKKKQLFFFLLLQQQQLHKSLLLILQQIIVKIVVAVVIIAVASAVVAARTTTASSSSLSSLSSAHTGIIMTFPAFGTALQFHNQFNTFHHQHHRRQVNNHHQLPQIQQQQQNRQRWYEVSPSSSSSSSSSLLSSNYYYYSSTPSTPTTTTGGNNNNNNNNNMMSLDVSENAPRGDGDAITTFVMLQEWAINYAGVQTSDGFQIITTTTDDNNNNDNDALAVTVQDLQADSPVLYVPNELMLMGSKTKQELLLSGRLSQQTLDDIEQSLIYDKLGSRTSLSLKNIMDDPNEQQKLLSEFYLFVKVLMEYESSSSSSSANGGQQSQSQSSPWFPWLSTLPRFFSNGASMTDFCYGCLPPYAAKLALEEKKRHQLFVDVIIQHQQQQQTTTSGNNGGVLPPPLLLQPSTVMNDVVTKWAFSVVNTRSVEIRFSGPAAADTTIGDGSSIGDVDLAIIPVADYFNHGNEHIGETNTCLSFDDNLNCYAYTTRPVMAGSPLLITYGDSTNPSKLLAKYGFLDESSKATYCKYIINDDNDLSITQQMKDMGYPHRMLFYDDGSISDEVWNVILYEQLGNTLSGSQQQKQQEFYEAVMRGDVDEVRRIHQEHFTKTFKVLKQHVDFLMNELDELDIGIETQLQYGSHAYRHPRLPLLRRHNKYIQTIIERVQMNLDSMM